jgi:aryl-alcohol dehydrogenase-like predicted oxidoreductase
MKYGPIGTLDRVSRLVLGIDHHSDYDAVARQCDAFMAAGGNAFDTAFHYGAWRERALGAFLQRHRVGELVSVVVKGGHTPFCTPEHLDDQLAASLDHLGIARAQIFLLHRDNPEVPVGEFVDCLNRHQDAGRIEIFGASNWSEARVDEANSYAEAHGLRGMSVVSNQFGLACMNHPLWPGARTAATAASRAWHDHRHMPLLAYSPLGRGFLSDASKTGARATEIARSFVTDENRTRRSRAVELSRERGATLVDVALAYVLNQPFPTFAVIGPRTDAQLASSLSSLNLALDQAEIDWLDSGVRATCY